MVLGINGLAAAEEPTESRSKGSSRASFNVSIPVGDAAPVAECVLPERSPAALILKLSPRLLEHDKNAEIPSFLFGEKVAGSPTSEITVDGQAEARKDGMVMRAEHIQFNTLTDTMRAQDSVRLFQDGNYFAGPALELKMDTRQGSMQAPDFFLSSVNGTGKANKAIFINREQTLMQDVDYSTCSPTKRDWYLKADEVLFDTAEEQGKGKSGTIYFKDVPIAYMPKFNFALGNERRSGFLTPFAGASSKSGLQLTFPYYWNIAPNRDLTLYPRYFSQRGEQLGADFRYMGERNQLGQLRSEYMVHDQQAEISRYSFSWQHRENFLPQLAFTANYNAVSDSNYFTDFSRTLAASAQTFLPRDGTFVYTSPYYGVTSLRLSNFQTLQNSSTPITPPFARLPQITWNYNKVDYYGFDGNILADATKFSHPTLQAGDRYVAKPSLSYPFIAPFGFFTPKLSVHTTNYALNAIDGTNAQNLSRQVPILSLDTGLFFERRANLFGTALTQTLEPRLFYLRTPYRNQDNLPNFDSGLADLNFAQIFSDNAYAGQDRIADANQLTFALASRYITDQSGQERLRLAIAERYSFKDTQVTLPGVDTNTQHRSDLLFTGNGQVSKSFYADTGLLFNSEDYSLTRYNAALRYIPERGKAVTVAYRYNHDVLRQVDLSSQWPIMANLYVVGRVNYSLQDRLAVENIMGLEYNGGCWVARAVLQRFASAANSSTTTIMFQLELNGFASLGSSPAEILRRNVPGYSILNSRDSSPSRFTQYE